jgi:hypothetical protein
MDKKAAQFRAQFDEANAKKVKVAKEAMNK